MSKLIAANWKMNPSSYPKARNLFDRLKEEKQKRGDIKTEIVICPPFPFLLLGKNYEFELGAQNCFWEETGAYTGEVSPKMLKSAGANFVIINHSERRKMFGENGEMANKKIKKALKTGLTPILCAGENAKEREEGKKFAVVERQIKEGINRIKNLEEIIIAYEPVWAIGSGKTPSPEEVAKMAEFVKKEMASEEVYSRFLYGGSVKKENAEDYLKIDKVDGFLLGGASLNPGEFMKIVDIAEKY